MTILNKRLVRYLLLLILVVGGMLAYPMAQPTNAQAAISPCDAIPDGLARSFCNNSPIPIPSIPTSPGDLLPNSPLGLLPGVPGPGSLGGAVASAIARPFFQEVAQLESEAVVDALKKEANEIQHTTNPTFTSRWFRLEYGLVLGLTLLVALPMLIWRLFLSAWRLDLGEAGHGITLFMVFILLAGVLPAIVGGLVYFFDNGVAPALMGETSRQGLHTMQQIQTSLIKSSNSNNWGIALFLAVAALFVGSVNGIIVEFQLLFRDFMLYIMVPVEVILLGLSIGGSSWAWDRLVRSTQILIALILFPTMLAFILFVGLNFLANSNGHQGFFPAVAGSVLLVFSSLIAWAGYKFVHDPYLHYQYQKVKGHFDTISSTIMKTVAQEKIAETVS